MSGLSEASVVSRQKLTFAAIVATTVSMFAFAANSLLCRMALQDNSIDPASFTLVRIGSGALVLGIILMLRSGSRTIAGSWKAAFFLSLYALPFSFAYLDLTTGTGALILFGSVQATMMISALMRGERPGVRQWGGLLLAIIGLVYLVSPGLEAPSLMGSSLMIASGIGWGTYSVLGRGTTDALARTGGNFLRAILLVLPGYLFLMSGNLGASTNGFVLALLSGGVTSGLGYAVWYHALRSLTGTQASIVQLTVPVIAAVAGLVVLTEELTARLAISSAIILGGVALALLRYSETGGNGK